MKVAGSELRENMLSKVIQMSYMGADHDSHMYTNKPVAEKHSQKLDFICPVIQQ